MNDNIADLMQIVDAILVNNPGLADSFGQADQEAAERLRERLKHTDEPE